MSDSDYDPDDENKENGDDDVDYHSGPEDFFDHVEPEIKPPPGLIAKEPRGPMGYLDFKFTCIGPDELMSRMQDIVKQVEDNY